MRRHDPRSGPARVARAFAELEAAGRRRAYADRAALRRLLCDITRGQFHDEGARAIELPREEGGYPW